MLMVGKNHTTMGKIKDLIGMRFKEKKENEIISQSVGSDGIAD